jgi:hypothetical protein
MTAKNESKGSLTPHRHFTEHLVGVFKEPPRARIELKQFQKKALELKIQLFCFHGRPYHTTCLGYKEHF